jgi:hypothetical protein
MATLNPGIKYRAAAGTLTKAGGALTLRPDDMLRRVGDTLAISACEFQTDAVAAITSSAALTPAPLAETVLAGATAALRRVVDTGGITAAPALSTDGHSTLGATVAHITASAAAGAVDVQLYGYDEVSAAWAVVLDFGTAGTLSLAPLSTARVNLDCRGYDRLYLRVTVNGAAVQVSGWIAVAIG